MMTHSIWPGLFYRLPLQFSAPHTHAHTWVVNHPPNCQGMKRLHPYCTVFSLTIFCPPQNLAEIQTYLNILNQINQTVVLIPSMSVGISEVRWLCGVEYPNGRGSHLVLNDKTFIRCNYGEINWLACVFHVTFNELGTHVCNNKAYNDVTSQLQGPCFFVLPGIF